MNVLEVLHVVGLLLLWTAVAMLPPAAIGLTEGLAVPWAIAVASTAVGGGVLWLLTPKQISINRRE